ncbi:ubiquitin-conjugating enzyme/RWD-like protein [Pavlovales sp. CCMP2436]|nr:ubiquitin-conjugating enzyme/RWD-like protein [Pavlovales sp. CCMP2436]
MSGTTMANLRLLSDLKAVRLTPPEGVSASPVSDENLYVWNATIFGPDDSPWEGGVYTMRITFGEQYPDKPPRVRFCCEMFHPNIYPDGTLCMDLIQDNWSPIYSVSSILTAIRSLLTDCNCASPANPEAAHVFQTDLKGYNRRVRRIAEKSTES